MPKKTTCMARGCGKEFLPRKGNQMFCSRKCFKKEYYQRKKEEEKNHRFPIYRCPDCNYQGILDFNPVDDLDRWMGYKCPDCGLERDTSLDSIPDIEVTIVTVTEISTQE